MGTDHQKIVLSLLKKWRSLILEQRESLSEGDLEMFERLTRDTALVQARLDDIFSQLKQARPDKDTIELLREIGSRHAELLTELKKGADEISATLGDLRKNRTSLQGYRQTKASGPRFMNERT
jgi:hypothetical protein